MSLCCLAFRLNQASATVAETGAGRRWIDAVYTYLQERLRCRLALSPWTI